MRPQSRGDKVNPRQKNKSQTPDRGQLMERGDHIDTSMSNVSNSQREKNEERDLARKRHDEMMARASEMVKKFDQQVLKKKPEPAEDQSEDSYSDVEEDIPVEKKPPPA